MIHLMCVVVVIVHIYIMHIIKLKDRYKAGTILYNIRYEKHHKMLAENEIVKCVVCCLRRNTDMTSFKFLKPRCT